VIRGILHYLNTWGTKPLSAQTVDEATAQALRLLTSAAEFDSATGGINREANLYPVVKLITSNGVSRVEEQRLKSLFEEQVSRHV
jgi:proteasome beta subunit